jgi:acetylglutamate kinase
MLHASETDNAIARDKAQTLIDFLPWLQAFQGKIFVVKFGGNAMIDEALQEAFAQDMAYLQLVGIKPVVVHGGGPQITARLSELGIKSEFRGGMRVTSTEAITVVRDVLRNQISAQLADLIKTAGGNPVVFSGEDIDENGKYLFEGEKTFIYENALPIDIGLVGEVSRVNASLILEALNNGQIPVISTVAPVIDSHGNRGDLLNVNADLAAAAIAVELQAEKLVVLTDVPGLYSDWPNRDSRVSEITVDELEALLPSLETGMIPKMQACLSAVRHGVNRAQVIDGRIPHSVLLEIFTPEGVGTLVMPN